MSDNDKEHGDDVTKQLIIGGLRRLRGEVDALFEQAKSLWWAPREYTAQLQHYVARQAYPNPPEYIELREDGLVVPGALAVFEFGGVYVEPGSEYPGLPETARSRFAIQNPFNAKQFVVEEEDARYFVIESLIIGNSYLFGLMAGGGITLPATKFVASADPQIPLNHYATEGLKAQLIVKNMSDSPRAFRAKLIGLENVL